MINFYFQYLVRPSHLTYDDVKPLNVKVKPNQKEVSNFDLSLIFFFYEGVLKITETEAPK